MHMGRMKRTGAKVLFLGVALFLGSVGVSFATPTTLIWTPSTDIQPYGKIHFGADVYAPTRKRDANDGRLYVQQVYGPTFSLLSDKPENTILGKLWEPFGKVMAEAGFDYKKGFGPAADTYPFYFHTKVGVPEDAYFKNMPAVAIGIYDVGTKHNVTDNDVAYIRTAKTVVIGKLNLGRFSVGYFNGSAQLLRDKNSERDNAGPMIVWERTLSEINDRLWLCVDYQGTHSSYGAMNVGFSYKFTNNVSAIFGYDMYNNRNLTDTFTFQFDADF